MANCATMASRWVMHDDAVRCARYRVVTLGLLDNAIREHLECKRLHGADPFEIARQEYEALGSEYRAGNRAEGNGLSAGNRSQLLQNGRVPIGYASHDEPMRPFDASQRPVQDERETAELDMRAVLDAQPFRGRSPERLMPMADIGWEFEKTAS
jgi:hypothetical protein